MEIESVEKLTVKRQLKDYVREHVLRWFPHVRYVTYVRVEMEDGTVGYGEELPFQTWQNTRQQMISLVEGKNPVEFMNRDIGAGLRMAILDAMGKKTGSPIHRLLGTQKREEVDMAWWLPDMDLESYREGIENGVENGYSTVKIKARPWRDLSKIVLELDSEFGDSVDLYMDFNDNIRNVSRAREVLEEIDDRDIVSGIESPMPARNLEAYEKLSESLSSDLEVHYGRSSAHPLPHPGEEVFEKMFNVYVTGGSLQEMVREDAVLEAAGKDMFLQLRGAETSATYAAHIAAVLKQAKRGVNVRHDLYAGSPVEGGLKPVRGAARVPEKPGLGVEIDWTGLKSRETVELESLNPNVDCRIHYSADRAAEMTFSSTVEMEEAARRGELPLFAEGATIETEFLD
ncbi:MAG: enolase C-terminal domain-like protein [Candidatus Nanohaloarchaea archaeon]